ncbi:hypothetical protein HAX54_038892 [Datura stramonium]|uniref:Uncharacterized protein n=1 Tax=Datura stramonium TaxID=4076 RepID=A0ABS8VN77_DATST|nr:hypothetical protein [Datura stramonium]
MTTSLTLLPSLLTHNLRPPKKTLPKLESVPKSPSSTYSAPAQSNSVSAESDYTLATTSLFDSKSLEDLVPIVALKKWVRKRVLAYSQVVVSTSKTPYVLGPASRTRAHRNNQDGTPTIPNPPFTKSKVKSFSERKILKVKMVFPSSDPCLTTLWCKIEAQGWNPLFSDRNAFVAKIEMVEFFKNFSISKGCVTTRVGKVIVVFDSAKLGSLLGVSCEGFVTFQKNKWPDLPLPLNPLDIVHKFSGNPSRTSMSKVLKKSMSPYHRFLFAFVIKNLIPRQERMDVASYLDLTLMELCDREIPLIFLNCSLPISPRL